MAYQINKTDGTIIATVPDGQIDQISTDLTLIGKNYSGFGDQLNENFVHLLENFANASRPQNPIQGQLWFDTLEVTLKIYNGKEFIPVSSTAISDRQPAGLRVGDLWFDNINKQLNFFDGSRLVLISPIYTVSQGKSGLVVESVTDTLGQTRVISLLYVSDVLLGIFSKDAFTPSTPIQGYRTADGDFKIDAGFNTANLSTFKFNVTCTNAESLDGRPASDYLRSQGANVIKGQLQVANDDGLLIAPAADSPTSGSASFVLNSGDAVLSNLTAGRDMQLTVRRGVAQESAITILSNARSVGLYEGFLTSSVNVGGSLTVGGNLTVVGDITTVSSSELVIVDKNITLAQKTDEDGNYIQSTDAEAEGGGITLAGDTGKSINWSANPVSQWTSSENFNLADGKYYAINNFPLIQQIDPNDPNSKFKLTDHITEIEGISIFGKREKLIVGPYPVEDPALLTIENSTIATHEGEDLELAPDGNIVLIGTPTITGLAEPENPQDASTKNYVDKQNRLQPIFLSTTLSDPNELMEADYYNLLNTMIQIIKTHTGDNVTTSYNIGSNIIETSSIIVYVDTIKRNLGQGVDDYSIDITNNTIEFVTAPLSGQNIEIVDPGVSIGTIVKLLCTVVENTPVTVNPTLTTSTESFLVSDGFGGLSDSDAPGITSAGVDAVTVPKQPVAVSRIIKTFRYEPAGWNLLTDEPWTP